MEGPDPKAYVYYHERIASKVGTGDTAKDATMENIWRGVLLEDGTWRVELLDMYDEPTGYGEVVKPSEIEGRFTIMDNYAPKPTSPKQKQADRIAARAERHLAEGEHLSAEFEFSKALKLDEDNVRANFGLGRTYLATGDTEKAREVFTKLSTIEAVLEPRNKYIFNEFGMQLRKLGMYAEAVRHYHRALLVEMHDENLWFNLGRALYEGGMYAASLKAFARALVLKPELEEARQFQCAAEARLKEQDQ